MRNPRPSSPGLSPRRGRMMSAPPKPSPEHWKGRRFSAPSISARALGRYRVSQSCFRNSECPTPPNPLHADTSDMAALQASIEANAQMSQSSPALAARSKHASSPVDASPSVDASPPSIPSDDKESSNKETSNSNSGSAQIGSHTPCASAGICASVGCAPSKAPCCLFRCCDMSHAMCERSHMCVCRLCALKSTMLLVTLLRHGHAPHLPIHRLISPRKQRFPRQQQ